MAGLPAPRTIVSVLGYVGMGNFGDEYILATVDRRLRELVCGCSIVAVGENPLHTLRERGIYSITLQDKRVLDRVLAASSAALVIAGLLFDQGIRWSIGKAELVSSMPHTDIAGIAAYVELAYMNDARPVLYGIRCGTRSTWRTDARLCASWGVWARCSSRAMRRPPSSSARAGCATSR